MRLMHPDMRPASAPIRIRFDGAEIEAIPGETIAAALAAADIVAVRKTRTGAPRGPFCGMGVCFDCLVTVDGRPNQRACLTAVAPGMEVRSAPVASAEPPGPAAPTEEVPCDALIVGAGPAGLSAALGLARAGARVIVADERPYSGGQYFKPLAASQAVDPVHLDRQFRTGAELRLAVERAGATILTEATVWAAFSPHEVAAVVAGRSVLFQPRRLVLATGAYEQPLSVPGWTLPGVMTVGGLQTLARSYRVAPGQRIVIAGNGPLCLQTALELREGGANVVAVLEAAARPGFGRLRELAAAAVADPALTLHGAALAARLYDILHWRRRVTGVLGEDRVHAVEAADLVIEADILALGYGFAASSELARGLGCAHRFVARGSGSMETVTDGVGRTSIPQVFAVGDGARFGGAQIALAQGALAAAAVARDLGLPAADTPAESRSLERARRFQAALWQLFEAAPLAAQVIDPDAIVCRCEEVRADDLREFIRAGYDTPAALKRLTRVGMGRCQGRYCAATVARLCAAEVGEFDLFAPRPPAKPVPVHALSLERPEWSGSPDLLPPDMARAKERTGEQGVSRAAKSLETVDTLVVGGGVAGACLAYWLSREGIETLVVERDELALQASGANAGSLHVQLLSYDFGPAAPPGIRAVDTLPLGPASIGLWQEIERDTAEDLEIKICGGLMLAESERDVALLKDKIAVEKSRGIHTELLGANELRDLEPAIGEAAIAAEWCPGEGKINPLRSFFSVVGRAKALGARFQRGCDVQAMARDGTGWKVTTSRGEIACKRLVNAAGPWAAEVAALAGARIPVRGAPLQMIVTEPTAPTLNCLVAHAARHLTLKQAASGAFLVGGGWTAALDRDHRLSRPQRPSVEGNLWIASRAVPALAPLHAVRMWAGINVSIDRAPILGEMPGLPGFYNCVSANGYTLAPVLARLTTEMLTGRSPSLPVEPYSIARFG